MITPSISRGGNHSLNGNLVLSYEINMFSEMLGEEGAEGGGDTKSGEHAVRADIMAILINIFGEESRDDI